MICNLILNTVCWPGIIVLGTWEALDKPPPSSYPASFVVSQGVMGWK